MWVSLRAGVSCVFVGYFGWGCTRGVCDFCSFVCFFFFFKQKTAYEMRISDWSSDVCSSDLDLQQPRTIADHPDRLVGNVDRQRLPVPFEQECAGFASLAYDFRQMQQFAFESDLAAGDTANVQQVVDQLRDMA